ncbi:peroxidase [Striga asiatica]|uniref:peroxidase n=1 Tax=Striga asiatica TaxID=4170 RepID=A0A5A7QQ50_STRAF|nr:peroxidase [Striga asiatica]
MTHIQITLLEKSMAPLFPFLLSAVSASPPPALRTAFYSETCPQAEAIARGVLRQAMAREIRIAASVMRLQFHDCLVNDCDGSLLLDDTPNMVGEKLALSNIDSLRSYEVIDEIKEALERTCPGIVSCADIIIMAARDAVLLSEGPHWEVKLGEFFGAFVEGMIKLGIFAVRDCRVVNDGPLLLTQAQRQGSVCFPTDVNCVNCYCTCQDSSRGLSLKCDNNFSAISCLFACWDDGLVIQAKSVILLNGSVLCLEPSKVFKLYG